MTRARQPAAPTDRATTPRGPATKRWGIRTLGWLALALVSVLASNWFYAQEVTDFVLATFAGTVVGLVGAAYTSIRGLQAWQGLGKL
jgi:hypothetical protein